jgi:hypothetical protein
LQERFHRLTWLLHYATWTWQDRAIAVSAAVAASIRANVGTRVPVDIVLNRVDVDRFRRCARRLLEAMSMECAPVCTAVGGIPEVIRPGETGMLAEPRRPDQLARVAGDLL